MTAVLVVLAVLLVAGLATAVVLGLRLREAHRRISALELEIEQRKAAVPPGPEGGGAVRTAERMVRTVIGTAAKVREQGVGGLFLESIDDLSRWALEDRSEIARLAAEDGTITVLFSDIEGSTALNAKLGDEGFVRLLIAHDVQVRAHVERRNGHIVKSQGDGFMVVFTSPLDAVQAGLDIQRSLFELRGWRVRRPPLRVRVGIHEGPAIARGDDFFGQTVAMAARVGAQASGGEILVSEPVAGQLVDDRRFALSAREPVQLKGIPGSHVLWRVQRRRSRRT